MFARGEERVERDLLDELKAFPKALLPIADFLRSGVDINPSVTNDLSPVIKSENGNAWATTTAAVTKAIIVGEGWGIARKRAARKRAARGGMKVVAWR